VTAISEFRPEVLPDAPGVPPPLVDRAIRHAAIELCDNAFVWRVKLDPKDIVAGTGEYTIDASPCGRVVTVMYAGHDGVRMLPTTERQLDDSEDGWRISTSRAAVSSWYYLPDRNTIRLALAPDVSKAQALNLSVSLKPTQDSTDLPDVLYDDYLETVGHGARARVLAMSGVGWANPQLAGYHKAEFDRLIRKHRAERLNDFTRQSSLSFKPHAYACSWKRGRRDMDCD
jgi:hypothetical protein